MKTVELTREEGPVSYDCWGKPEYEDIYVLKSEGNTILRSEFKPDMLMDFLKDNGFEVLDKTNE